MPRLIKSNLYFGGSEPAAPDGTLVGSDLLRGLDPLEVHGLVHGAGDRPPAVVGGQVGEAEVLQAGALVLSSPVVPQQLLRILATYNIILRLAFHHLESFHIIKTTTK